MATMSATGGRSTGMTKDERFVIIASSLGTVFEWYDFYLAGSLAANISANFFSGVNPTAGFIFTLLGFAAGTQQPRTKPQNGPLKPPHQIFERSLISGLGARDQIALLHLSLQNPDCHLRNAHFRCLHCIRAKVPKR
mgnify:CR=1 FL=1